MDICLNCLKNFEPNANENTVKLSEDKSTCDNCGKLENLVAEFDDYSKEYNNAIDAVNSVLKDYFDFVPLNKAIAITDVLAEKGVIKLNNLQTIEKLKSENAELYKSINDMATNVAKINEALPKMRAEVRNEFAANLKKHVYFDHKEQRNVVAEIIIDHYLKEQLGGDNQ